MRHCNFIRSQCASLLALFFTLTASAQTEIYNNPISSQAEFDQFTVVDYNGDDHIGDAYTWQFNEWQNCAYYRYSSLQAADDWLILPTLTLSPGREYTISFEAKAQLANYPEAYSILIGKGSDLASYTTIKPKAAITNTSYEVQTVTTTVTEQAAYHFAIRCLSDVDMSTFSIRNVIVTEGVSLATPAAVENLTATAAAAGELKATISFDAPTKDNTGAALSTITKIEVKRGTTLVATLSNPTPGNHYSVTDENADAGFNTYTVVATNDAGEGKSAETQVFVGSDTPLAPNALIIKDNVDGTATLSWTAPGSQGVNGGYVDTSSLTYKIYLEGDDGTPSLVASGISATTHTLTLPSQQSQDIKFYRVSAVSASSVEGDHALGSIFVGNPYLLPYEESFANASPTHYASSMKNGTNGFSPVTWLSSDDDEGSMLASGLNAGEESTLLLGKVSLKGAVNPVLAFNHYLVPTRNARLIVEIRKPNGTLAAVETVNAQSMTGTASWKLKTVDMKQFVNEEYIVLTFRAVANEDHCSFGVDAVSLRDVLANDLQVTVAAPSSVKAGNNANIVATVKNVGTETATDYTIDIMMNGEKAISISGTSLVANEQKAFTYEYASKVTDPESFSIIAVVNFSADENTDNNTSEAVTMNITQPTLPSIDDLTATANGNSVELSWTGISTESETVTDDFEAYDDFTITNLGAWTLYDGDGYQTWKPSMYPNFQNAGSPMAYIVFNPTTLGIDLSDDENAEYVPHSGNKFLASMAADTYLTGNNDYLISEMLSGKAQTVKLFAKSFDMSGYYKETFEIRYSTTGNAPEDFTKTVKTQECGSTWTEYSADLPAGARYFAVVCTSNNKMMLQIDDVTYEKGGLSAESYNIYRDKTLIATVAAGVTTYTDTDVDGGDHVYNVTAVYTDGESSLSNDATVTITAINGVAADADLDAVHYGLDGKRISPDAKGVHIVKFSNGSIKKIMK